MRWYVGDFVDQLEIETAECIFWPTARSLAKRSPLQGYAKVNVEYKRIRFLPVFLLGPSKLALQIISVTQWCSLMPLEGVNSYSSWTTVSFVQFRLREQVLYIICQTNQYYNRRSLLAIRSFQIEDSKLCSCKRRRNEKINTQHVGRACDVVSHFRLQRTSNDKHGHKSK